MELTIVILGVVVLILLCVFFYYVPLFLWISARVSGVRISLIQLMLMRIRKVPVNTIVQAMIEAHKAGLSDVTRDDLEAHYLAGGDVEKVVHALVSASKANIDLGFKMATAIDLAGRDVFQAVQMSVNPKVIDTPPVTAVAKDGIARKIGDRNSASPNRIAVVTDVSPVLPPSVTPEALSTNVVVVVVPSTAPAVVATASAISAPLILGSFPSSSNMSALEATPISVPIVSNISTNKNAKMTTIKFSVKIPLNCSLPKTGIMLGIDSPLLKSGSRP